jgi:hypothetical protein
MTIRRKVITLASDLAVRLAGALGSSVVGVFGIVLGDKAGDAAVVPVAHVARERQVEAGDFQELFAFARVTQAFRLTHTVQRFALVSLTPGHGHYSPARMCQILTAENRCGISGSGSRHTAEFEPHDIAADLPMKSETCVYRLGWTLSACAVTRL